MVCTVPSPRTLQSEFGVVDLVVGVLLKAIITAIHPCDVGVALHVNTDGGVEGVGVIDGHASVVHDHEVPVCSCPGVFGVGAAGSGRSADAWCEGGVVVHLPVGVEHRHVDFTGVVGRNVDHGFNEEGHLVGSTAGRELVSLTTCVGVGEGVARAVSSLGRNNTVWTLDEVHEVGLDVSCTAVALAVQANRDDARKQTVVVGLNNGSLVVSLLRRVTVFGPFIGYGNHDLGGVGVPTVVGLRGGVARNIACSVLP